jgi:hypothetical protein
MRSEALDEAVKQVIVREFVGESVLWAERPRVFGQVLMSFGIWLFAIPWTAFALFWESIVLAPLLGGLLGYEVGGEPPGTGLQLGMWAMALFGVPFVLVGFGMLLAPLVAWLKGRRQLFVLSNRRLAVIETGRTLTVRNIPLGEIGTITRSEKPDGSGTLSLGLGYERDSDGDRVAKAESIGRISDVRHVEKLIEGQRDRLRRG